MQPKVNILFIEDERNILTFVRKLLYGHNYKVTTAITGTEGLQLINSICPDLILLDLGLPDMDGQTIIRHGRFVNGPTVQSSSSLPVQMNMKR